MDAEVNYITPEGYFKLKARYEELYSGERPKLIETISWAAGNGDRSENGDYIYGRKRLREVDREINHLSRRMKDAKVVDPTQQPDRNRAWFGATVTIVDEDDVERTVTLVGEDEADPNAGSLSYVSPLAQALFGKEVGDEVQVAGGDVEIIAIG